MKFKTVEEALAHLQGLVDSSPFKGPVKVVPFNGQYDIYFHAEAMRPLAFDNRRLAYCEVWWVLQTKIISAYVEAPK